MVVGKVQSFRGSTWADFPFNACQKSSHPCAAATVHLPCIHQSPQAYLIDPSLNDPSLNIHESVYELKPFSASM